VYNYGMTEVPQQDWAAYEALAAASDTVALRNLTPVDRFALYEDLFDLIWDVRRGLGDWEKLERWSWEQKLALRRQFVQAWHKRNPSCRA
jgi:hypothetical protein